MAPTLRSPGYCPNGPWTLSIPGRSVSGVRSRAPTDDRQEAATVFIQIISGTCTREQEMREVGERWTRELGPGATGWLGGTYGFTDDGMFVAVVRFDSRESAMANSARPEQAEWWAEMEALFDGPVEFHDCDDVTLMLDGGSDEAGFVQVIRGKVDNPETLRTMMTDTEALHEMRPE